MSNTKVESSPKNSYFLWLKENKSDIKKMYFSNYEPKIINGRKENISTLVTKKAGEVWNSLDKSIKDSYQEQVQLLKEKEKEVEVKSSKPYISSLLCKLLGLDNGSQINKGEITKKVNKYIKDNKLSESDKKFKLDESLANLFGLSSGDSINNSKISSYLKDHISNKPFVDSPPPYEKVESNKKTHNSPKQKKRKAIPKAVRKRVFAEYIKTDDPNKLTGECFVECGNKINIDGFEVGHIVSVAEGGSDEIENLRPICSPCNKSMGKQNLLNFKEKYGFNSDDIDTITGLIEECNCNKMEIVYTNNQLVTENDDVSSKINVLEESTLCINSINAIEKTKLDTIKLEYELKTEEIKETLAELDKLHKKQQTEIKSSLKSNNSKIKENQSKLEELNLLIQLNMDKITLNEVKIQNINETESKYQERKVFLENKNKVEKENLMAELEEEVKRELEREQLKQQIREKLLLNNTTEDLISLA
jgi:hypothetical protein